MITLGADETITVYGVHAASVTADDFVFNQAPVTENSGTMQIGDDAHLALSGTINNTGTIELNSTGDETDLLIIQQGITLTGGGHVVLSDAAENMIHGTSADVTLTNVDNTISGSGDLGGGLLVLVNDTHGIIEATGAFNPLTIDTGSFTNHGLVLSNGEGGLEIKGSLDSDGVLEANTGLLKVDGDAIGGGSAVINSGKMEFVSASDAAVHFSGNGSGTLVLDDVSHFTGTVTGFSAGDTIDLAGIDPANVSVGNSGSLEVHYGPGANDFFSLDGNYDPTGFAVVTDHNGGTDIVWDHGAPAIETDQVSVLRNSDGTTTIAGLQLSKFRPGRLCRGLRGHRDSRQFRIHSHGQHQHRPGSGHRAVRRQHRGHRHRQLRGRRNRELRLQRGGDRPERCAAGHGRQGRYFRDSLFGHADGRRRPGPVCVRADVGPTDAQHTITDFVAGLDKIDLRQFGNIGALSDLTEVQQGSDTLITLDGHDSLLLKNVAAANLSANDFILHPGTHA